MEYWKKNMMLPVSRPSLKQRQQLIDHLKQKNINSVFHYILLHNLEMGGKFGYKNGDFPITEQISNSLIRLPFYNDISEKDLNTILDEIKCYTLE